MNILQVISSTVAGGRELFTIPLSLKLKEKGHVSTILCVKGSPVDTEASARGIPVLYTEMDSYIDPGEIRKLARLFKEKKFDITHSHWTKDLSNLILAAKFGGMTPIVCTKHVYSTVKKKDPFHAWIFRNVKCVMAVSELVRKNVLDTVPVDPAKVVTVYNGIDPVNEWVPGKYGGKFREETGFRAKDALICMAGRINRGKGQHVLLEAVPAVLKSSPSAKFIFAGKPEGPEERAYFEGLLRRVEELNIGEHVKFLGFRRDLPSVMDASDIIVMCSVFETFGLVLIEGMALKKPVIGTAAGGVPEIVTDGVDGRTFPCDDPVKLAELINGLIARPEEAARLGEAARKTVLEKFNIDKTITQIEGIYKTFAKQG